MDVGAAALYIFFLIMIVAEVAIGLGVLIYLARRFHMILSATAAGADKVVWSSEPVFDWVGPALQPLYLAFMAIVPGIFVCLPLRLSFLPAGSGGRILIGSLLSFWLLFPLFAVSTCTGPSPWLLIFPRVLPVLGRKLRATIVVYLVSGALFVSCGLLLYLAISSRVLILMILASAAGSTVVVLYARLLGRWIWIVNQRKGVRRVRDEPLPIAGMSKPDKTERGRRRKRRSSSDIVAADPWRVPLATTGSPEEPPEPEEQPAAQPPPAWMDVDRTAYGFAPVDATPEPPQQKPAFHDASQESARTADLPNPPAHVPTAALPPTRTVEAVQSREPEPIPTYPLVSGIYTFPWYPTTVFLWVRLTLCLVVVMVLLAMLMAIAPRRTPDSEDAETPGSRLPFATSFTTMKNARPLVSRAVFDNPEHRKESPA